VLTGGDADYEALANKVSNTASVLEDDAPLSATYDLSQMADFRFMIFALLCLFVGSLISVLFEQYNWLS
jgi:hypothetical protein